MSNWSSQRHQDRRSVTQTEAVSHLHDKILKRMTLWCFPNDTHEHAQGISAAGAGRCTGRNLRHRRPQPDFADKESRQLWRTSSPSQSNFYFSSLLCLFFYSQTRFLQHFQSRIYETLQCLNRGSNGNIGQTVYYAKTDSGIKHQNRNSFTAADLPLSCNLDPKYLPRCFKKWKWRLSINE